MWAIQITLSESTFIVGNDFSLRNPSMTGGRHEPYGIDAARAGERAFETGAASDGCGAQGQGAHCPCVDPQWMPFFAALLSSTCGARIGLCGCFVYLAGFCWRSCPASCFPGLGLSRFWVLSFSSTLCSSWRTLAACGCCSTACNEPVSCHNVPVPRPADRNQHCRWGFGWGSCGRATEQPLPAHR